MHDNVCSSPQVCFMRKHSSEQVVGLGNRSCSKSILHFETCGCEKRVLVLLKDHNTYPVFPQVGFGEGECTQTYPTLRKVESLFPVDPWLKESILENRFEKIKVESTKM